MSYRPSVDKKKRRIQILVTDWFSSGRERARRAFAWEDMRQQRQCLLRIQSRRENTDVIITAEEKHDQLTLILTSLSHFTVIFFSFLLISSRILSYRISDGYWQKSNKLILIKMMFADENRDKIVRWNDNWVKRTWKWRIKLSYERQKEKKGKLMEEMMHYYTLNH